MFRRRTEGTEAHADAQRGPRIEPLEARELFSAATAATTVPGYTPAQIRHAYAFDQVALPGGAAADGTGQTIAVVDAFNDPNLQADLAVFDAQFGLAAANLTVVNQTGGAALPTTDAGWAGEIALDVEWAHAIAPGAKILLVEANSASLSDLMAGVDYARHAAGVSTVSMSWGGSEFFSWTGGESSSQTNYDPYFTTPAGHTGVTFVASAGDSGSQAGVQWPAISPNVVSVGGTSLYTSDASGTYYGEAGWSGTNGGFSQVEPEPAYQQGVQTTGARTAPDVAYNADPNTGFAVYDSLAYQGVSGWQQVGGTSAGSPQWAALIAIADQGRAAAGLGTLDGTTQTLPALYAMYAAPTDSAYAAYASDFNDVSVGGGTQYRWRWGGIGQSGYTANYGYDLVTGLGSPRAGAVVAALVGSPSGTTSGNAGATHLPASPVGVTVLSSPTGTAIDGEHATVRLKLTNTTGAAFAGPVTVDLYASTDAALSADDAKVGTLTLDNLRLGAGKARAVKLAFTYPSGLAGGTYHLIASASVPTTNTAAAVSVAPSAVAVAPATVDLSTAFSRTAISVRPGSADTATVVVRNVGNVTATGALSLNLYASTDATLDATLDASDVLLAALADRKVNLKPGQAVKFTVRFVAPAGRAAGTYDLIAAATPSTNPADGNPANNAATAGTTA
jgi:hypothetical protein